MYDKQKQVLRTRMHDETKSPSFNTTARWHNAPEGIVTSHYT